MRSLLIALACVAGLMLVSLGGLYWNGFLAAQQEAIRTNVVEESLSYTRGMRRELGRLQVEYATADAGGKAGIRAYVRDTWSEVDTSDYPANLKTFLAELGAL